MSILDNDNDDSNYMVDVWATLANVALYDYKVVSNLLTTNLELA